MLVFQPSGSKVDIVPAWLIEEGAGMSQQEYKRRLRAKTSGGQSGGGDKEDKGGGKGKGKKGDKKGDKKDKKN